ncbi:MAG: hypothetical protein A3F84_18565 [Candidatus Handelsmanbacteria bacterium RIFCSPLOWO2_12_FULL_64_10]|uniref:histidine kinase n=1 Tax=Handelsmanbacteria sp. (strain RIFCSPLOWO2_12_FULL_64_10) TaxID=1817868 RepID=A0A1F6CJ66_HANXR|nr:MAG: hypothetical protein A3F84_18565 [Candidatus Handelsmanbacteria bacterium RIFCSPLOWO2_12_FULL_64_10]
MAEFEAFYASRIAPILRRHGLTELPWRGRAMPDSVFVRLFEFKNPSEFAEKKKTIGEDPAWKKAMRDIGTLFGTRWPVEVIPHSLLLYTAPAGPGTTVQAGPGKRTPAGPGRGAWRNYDVADGLAATYIQSIFQDRDGHLWFGTYFNGASRYDGRTFTTFTAKDGLADDNVSVILQDREGVLWFGTQKGLIRYDPSPSGPALRSGQAWKTFTTKDGLANDYVHAILQDRAGNLWFGTIGGGVSRYDRSGRGSSGPSGGGTFTTFTTRDGLGDNWVLVLYEDRDGVLWFGTQGGVSRFDRDGRRSGEPSGRGTWKTFTEKDGLGKGGVQAIAQDREGTFWFGTAEGGLSRYDGRTWRTFTAKDGLANDLVSAIVQDRDGRAGNYVLAILQDRKGDLWIGTWGEGVSRADPLRLAGAPSELALSETKGQTSSDLGPAFTTFTIRDGLTSNCVYSISQDREGRLWFGTQGGACRYDGRTFLTFTQEDGLAPNAVISVLQDPRGHLWFAVDGGGMVRHDGQAFQTLLQKDGLSSNVMSNAVVQDREGNLWFGTIEGATRYRPPVPSPPPIFINAVVADRRYERASQVSIPSSVELTAFEFQGISLKTRPEAMVYRYRLRGFDPDWRTTHARRVEYQNLPRGSYTFEVEAVDRDLVYSNAPATVALRVRMPYERIGWMSALGIALVLATYQTRRVIRRDRRLQKSNEDLRQEIIQRQRAEEERARLDERLQQLEYLYRLRSALGDARSTDEVIRRAGQTLMEVLSASHSGGVLIEHDGREWRFGETENVECRMSNVEIENPNDPNSKFEVRNSKSGGARYDRGLSWGGKQRGSLTLFCGVELSEAQEKTLLNETAGQIVGALEARELEMQILQSSRLVSLGQMAAGVAHELNQPLTVISGAAEDVYVRLAEGIGISEEQLKEKMKDVLDLAERMTGTIEHLRVFSRDISKEPGALFSVNDVIRSGLRLIETQLKNHNIALHLDLGEGLPPVSGHPHRMEQVFLNLLGNARDALDEKTSPSPSHKKNDRRPSLSQWERPTAKAVGRRGWGEGMGVGEVPRTTDHESRGWTKGVWVRTRQEGDEVVAEVEDNGVGMDEAIRARLFEPFFTTKPADRGTGLGLSISYAIVRDHGGQIACESRKGEGTVFRVRLPAAEEI